jgi:hypothetical protein
VLTEPPEFLNRQDSDEVFLTNLVSGGPVSVLGGDGIQEYYVQGVNSHYRELILTGGIGQDLIQIQNEVDGFARTLRLNGGANDDVLRIRANGPINASLVVFDGSSGNDTIEIRTVSSLLPPLSISGVVRVFGGSGNDVLRIFESSAIEELDARMGNGNDSIRLGPGSGSTGINVDMGSGQDSLIVGSSFRHANLNVDFGTGDDTFVILQNSIIDRAVFDGGTGDGDEWRVSTGVEPDEWSIPDLTRINFETVFDNQQPSS